MSLASWRLLLLGLGALVISCKSPGGVQKITVDSGTAVADQDAPPWIVALRHHGETLSYCGGTVVASGWILTAAHCPIQKREGEYPEYEGDVAVVGSATLPPPAEEGQPRVVRVLRHECFAPPKGRWDEAKEPIPHDIALVELDRKLSSSPVVLSDTTAPQGFKGRLLGWGYYHAGIGLALSTSLRVGSLERASCRWTTPSSFCAAGLAAACKGDSGGPLVADAGALSASPQFGLSVFGERTCRPKSVGLYLDVSAYRKWIEETITRPDAPRNCGPPPS